MERIPSIIHKMQERYDAGASPSELLVMLEDMRRELTRATLPSDHTSAPVSVWLPHGYTGPSVTSVYHNDVKETVAETKVIEQALPTNLAPNPVEPDLATAKAEPVQWVEDVPKVIVAQEPMQAEKVHIPFMGVPRPPLLTVVEQPEIELVPEVLPEVERAHEPEFEEEVSEPVIEMVIVAPEDEDKPLVLEPVAPVSDIFVITKGEDASIDQMLVADNNIAQVSDNMPDVDENIALPVVETEAEVPVVLTLNLPEADDDIMEEKQQWQPFRIPDGFLNGAGYKDTLVAERPRELHEILANRVLAKSDSSLSADAGVMEKIAGGKIADLRRAFSINDRFRFINSLFRGDETMFDRAIKTINNFGILAEAQYWMQRELVIKLGWNEEDELVQHFYQLVTRRFL